MKRILAGVILSTCISVIAYAGQADTLFQQANVAYQANDFSKSVEIYEQVSALGFQSPELEYNLGNAYFRQKNTGKAILHFERALLLSPGDEDVLHNLSIATAGLDERGQLPDFFLTKWWKGLRMALGSGVWGGIALVLWWLGFGGLAIWKLGKTRGQRKMGFTVGVVAILISLLPFCLAWNRMSFEKSTRLAIILTDRYSLKSAPDEAGSEILKLQEGEKIQLLDHLSGYWQVRLQNGDKGWVDEKDLEEI